MLNKIELDYAAGVWEFFLILSALKANYLTWEH